MRHVTEKYYIQLNIELPADRVRKHNGNDSVMKTIDGD